MTRPPITCLLAAAVTLSIAPGLHAFTEMEDLKLVPPTPADDDEFGSAVAIAPDSNLLVVGAAGRNETGVNSGLAYVYDADTGLLQRTLEADDPTEFSQFAAALDIAGTTALVGSATKDEPNNREGAAYLFDVTDGSQLRKLTASDSSTGDQFGIAVGLSGDLAVIGANTDGDGSAYVFDITTGSQLRKLTASSALSVRFFGGSIDISGNTAIIGASDTDNSTGSAYIFDITTGAQLHELTASDRAETHSFGIDVAIHGNYAIVGARGTDDNGSASGSAYVFNVTTGAQIFELQPSDAAAGDNFGFSVDMNSDQAFIGAVGVDDNAGAIYSFDYTTGTELDKLVASQLNDGDLLGWSVSANERYLLGGAQGSDESGFRSDSGAAYLFSVPEPSGMLLLLSGLVTIGFRRKRP